MTGNTDIDTFKEIYLALIHYSYMDCKRGCQISPEYISQPLLYLGVFTAITLFINHGWQY
jgi:hypothetical protein